MKCTTCGYETQPGAKFCVQCGTTIVAASPAAAGMAPMATPSMSPRPAPAPAPRAPAASTSSTGSRPAYTPPAPADKTVARAAAATSAMPAAAAASVPSTKPQRLGLIAGLLALFAVLCIGSFIAYKVLFSTEPKESQPATAAPAGDTTPPAPVQPAEAPKDGVAPAGPAATAPDGSTASQPATAGAPGADAKSAAAAPDAAKAAANTAKGDKGTTKAGTPGKTDTPTTTAAPAVAAPPPPRQAAAPAPAAAPQPDRWDLMRQAYEVCAREGLLDRLSCNARVGRQYCEGYWGKVPQCPVGAYGDRGN